MYIALCSVKDTERERNTGFLSNFTAHAPVISPPSLPPSLSSSTVAWVLWCSYRCLEIEWQFLRRWQAADLSHLHFASEGVCVCVSVCVSICEVPVV